MQTLELNGLQELNQEELRGIDGGGIGSWLSNFFCQEIIKVTDNGTLLDGIKGNTDIDLHLFGHQIF